MLIIGGTSLTVYPAAGLLDYYTGNRLVLINKTATARDGLANLVINESIGKALEGFYNGYSGWRCNKDEEAASLWQS